MHTNDGGKTWQPSQTYPGMQVNGLYGWTDMSTGNATLFTLGDGDYYWLNKNDGKGWAQYSFPSSENMNDVHGVPDPNNITNHYLWAVGDNSKVYHSNNSGATWTVQSTEYHHDNFHGVWFLNNQNGVIVGSTGIIYNTTTFGDKWKYREGDHSNPDYRGIHGVGRTFWAVGNGGKIIRSNNGGETWSGQGSGTTQNLNALRFQNDGQSGLTVGNNGTLLWTRNGGEDWTPVDAGKSTDFYCLSSGRQNDFLAGSSDGKIFHVDFQTNADVRYNPSVLNWGCIKDGKKPKPQVLDINVNNPGTEWTLNPDQDWMDVIPGSGNCKRQY